MMENVLSVRISSDPLITGVYGRFVVDVLDEDATYRGYVCAVENDHCMVRIGAMQHLRRLPMDKLRRTNWFQSLSLDLDDVPEEIDVLVSVEENQPESWQPACIIDGIVMDAFSFLNVEVQLPENVVKCYYVLDSSGAAFKRVRRRGYLGDPVIPQSFVSHEIPVSQFVSYCSNFADTLPKVRQMPRFRSRLMQEICGIMFMDATDDHVVVLVEEEYSQTLTDSEVKANVFKRVVSAVDNFMGKFTLATETISRTVLNELITRIVAGLDVSEPQEVHFEDLLKELSMEVFSFMDVYDQYQLRRTSKTLHRQLSCKTLRQCVILPNQRKHAIESLKVGPPGSAYRDLAHIIGSTISQDAKILYFIDNWEQSLFVLANVLKVMRVRLDWLVIANNSTLLLNEFLPFPKSSLMLYTHDFNTMHVNYLSAERYTNYAFCCRQLALKNCCFNSQLSICFRDVITLGNGWDIYWNLTPGRWNLRCCRDPFFIEIPRWRYSFEETTAVTFEASFRSALDDHCPVLRGHVIKNLFYWLNSLTSKDCEPQTCIWAFIELSYKLWKEKPPKHLNDVKADISHNFSRKSCILQTLALLLPCISDGFCCVANAVDADA
ncbi:uncharacterized protein LOC129589699 [Paramacrobiotus metropolitanus]|uniref:uncharacterized protein LOC129589699 n=1 Tax=Paramacrobiotus metropolitanus TaxID=2943436 RepID=UPI002445A4A9|nr:uncharacterized protein LOC129589699 [Paramacrobiotus metropolitanus]